MENKLLILCASLLVASSLNAKTTICYKNDWKNPSTIETIELEGGECNGKFSLKNMQKNGWYIKDIDIKSAKEGMNYKYILSDKDPINIDKSYLEKSNINTELSMLNEITKLSNVTNDTASINIANLKVGQSGIIQHNYNDGHSIIVSSAYVQSSNDSSSIIKFIPFLDLKQNAIPTTNRKVSNDDTFILNYMYDSSLLITPNVDSFRQIRDTFKTNTFAHSDIFAAYLKSQYQPLPNKKFIKEYAMSQNLGTIFIAIKSNLYIVDARTFSILKKQTISNVSKKTQMPFYSRIENIESNLLTSDFFDWIDFSVVKDFFNDNRTEEEILYGDLARSKNKDANTNYNTYYSNILGLNNDRQ